MKEQLKQFCLLEFVRQTYANFYPFADQHASRKMTTCKQRVFCVLRLTKTESAITVQRGFCNKFGCQPPNDSNILSFTLVPFLEQNMTALPANNISASRIPSIIQSPSCHLAECKTPLSPCPSSKTCPDMGLRTVLTVQKRKKATPIQ
ncbi:uncharacterized protein TNCV_3824191 [Trichonephila clavipes]|nr:uncharacterized protein TNCV_3824191 [Trichonephila clavipes]